MSRSLKALGLVTLLILASGCATGTKYSAMATSITPPAADLGRIYVYRVSALGALIKPKVFLDDKVVGKATARGFFYVDVPPGTHQLRTTTEVKRTLSLTLEAGQVRYVELKVGMGFFAGHVAPQLVDNAVGEKEIQKCKYTGPK